MIALEHLNVIDVICREGSFTRASERLFKARSAVSYSVKKVEEYYQVELFDRNAYRPQLTREGQLLIHRIQHLMQVAREFDEYARQLNSEVESELRIGVSSIFPVPLVTAMLHQLKQEYPNTVVHLEMESASGERLLLDEKVDIGIYGGMQQDPEVDYRRIGTFHLPVYVSESFPANPKTLSPTELANFPQAVLKASYKENPTVGVLKEGLQWYVSDHTTKKALIRSGLVWGRLPEHEVREEVESGHLVEVPGSDAMVVPAYVAKLNSRPLGPVGTRVWQFFDESREPF